MADLRSRDRDRIGQFDPDPPAPGRSAAGWSAIPIAGPVRSPCIISGWQLRILMHPPARLMSYRRTPEGLDIRTSGRASGRARPAAAWG